MGLQPEKTRVSVTYEPHYQVELNLKNRYIPTSEYILSFKDSSSLKEIGKSMQKTY